MFLLWEKKKPTYTFIEKLLQSVKEAFIALFIANSHKIKV